MAVKRTGAWVVALVAAPLLVSGGCLVDECALPARCCRSCDQPTARVACESCDADETPAYLCPARSTCALSAFVGQGPALCCPEGCEAVATRERPQRCEAEERYLHECAIDSHCFQAHQARVAGTVYVPLRVEAAGGSEPLLALWGVVSPGDEPEVWAVGLRGRILRRAAGSWSREQTPTSEPLTGIWGTAADGLWAVGGSGTILRRDASGWRRVSTPTTAYLHAIWGRADDAIWAVGAEGTALRYDGSSWTREATPTHAQLEDLHGDAEMLWAVGGEGTVLERRSEGWRRVSTPILRGWHAVQVDAAGAVWIAGDEGALLERRGPDWRGVTLSTAIAITDLGATEGALWAVGLSGLVLQRAADSWQQVSYFSAMNAPQDLYGLWGEGSALFVAGSAGTVLATGLDIGDTP